MASSGDTPPPLNNTPSPPGRNNQSGSAQGPFNADQHAQAHLGNAGVKRPQRISLNIAAKYAVKSAEPIKLEQVADNFMPSLEECITEIAVNAGLSIDNEIDISNLLNALTADVYVNAYSDKKSFVGTISLPNGFELEKADIRKVLVHRCGNNFRRFARSFATTAIEVMTTNYPLFSELIRKRADENNITPEEALYIFDGAEGAIIGRASEIRLASIKKMKLDKMDNFTASNGTSAGSAVSIAVHDVEDA